MIKYVAYTEICTSKTCTNHCVNYLSTSEISQYRKLVGRCIFVHHKLMVEEQNRKTETQLRLPNGIKIWQHAAHVGLAYLGERRRPFSSCFKSGSEVFRAASANYCASCHSVAPSVCNARTTPCRQQQQQQQQEVTSMHSAKQTPRVTLIRAPIGCMSDKSLCCR